MDDFKITINMDGDRIYTANVPLPETLKKALEEGKITEAQVIEYCEYITGKVFQDTYFEFLDAWIEERMKGTATKKPKGLWSSAKNKKG